MFRFCYICFQRGPIYGYVRSSSHAALTSEHVCLFPRMGRDRLTFTSSHDRHRPELCWCMCIPAPQLGDDHLGYLLRWTSLLTDHSRALALSALRPDQKSIPPSRSNDVGGGGLGEKSRYYRALWRHAVEVVLRVSCRSFAFACTLYLKFFCQFAPL